MTETPPTGCVLVVDDQEQNVRVLGTMLGQLGFEVMPALNSEQALRRLSSRPVDLILMDLLMPRIDGFELCRKIRENPHWAEIPVIFLSAADDKKLIVRAFEEGGVDYVTKPFSKPELISRVRTHLALKQARDHQKRLAEDKEELLGMITHQFQNHLAGMQMSAELLSERAHSASDPKLRAMAENIRDASGQMRESVRSLVANTAADHGFNIRLQTVDLVESVARAGSAYRDRAARKQLSLRVNSPSAGLVARADPAALDLVLDNLVSNAVKFSPQGSEITLSARREGDFVECRIQDRGPGFSKDDFQRMFQRYARLTARPTGGEPSTGLGLSIVKRMVEAMHADLACESATGQGATFILRLLAASHPNTQN